MTTFIDNPSPPSSQAAMQDLSSGARFPFDAPYEWWDREDEEAEPPVAPSWSIAAARGILSNLRDRRGIKQELQVGMIDDDVREEIVLTIAAIIEAAPVWFVINGGGKP